MNWHNLISTLRRLTSLLQCIVLLTLPNLYATLFVKDLKHSLTPTIIGTALVTLFVVLISRHPRYILLVCAPFILGVPVICVLMSQVGAQVNRYAILIVSTGNPEELGRFLNAAVIAGLSTLAMAAVLWFLLRNVTSQTVPWQARMGLGASSLALLGVILGPDLISSDKNRSINAAYKLATLYPAGTLYEGWNAWKIQKDLAERNNTVARVSRGMRISPPVKKRSVHVLLIGESARFKSLSVNGYSRDTTPLLRMRKDLVWFQDMISGATITRQSVPIIMTGLPADKFDLTRNSPSITSIARAAGYDTAWFSTQYRQGLATKASAYFASDAADYRFLCLEIGQTHFVNSAKDEQLIPLLKEQLDHSKKDVFIVLHTMGSHWLFTARYPKEFEKFPTEGLDPDAILQGRMTPPQTREKMLNAYDNALIYTDWCVNSMLEEVAKRGDLSTFWYLPDHGENGVDNVGSPFRHGFVTRDVMHVPAFAWFSPAYRNAYPDIVQRIESHAKEPLMSRMLFHTLLEVTGIASKSLNETLSLANPNFHPGHGLVMSINGRMVNYDKEVRD